MINDRVRKIIEQRKKEPALQEHFAYKERFLEELQDEFYEHGTWRKMDDYIESCKASLDFFMKRHNSFGNPEEAADQVIDDWLEIIKKRTAKLLNSGISKEDERIKNLVEIYKNLEKIQKNEEQEVKETRTRFETISRFEDIIGFLYAVKFIADFNNMEDPNYVRYAKIYDDYLDYFIYL